MTDLWAYEPWKCDNDYCPMDCGRCSKAEYEDEEYLDIPEES